MKTKQTLLICIILFTVIDLFGQKQNDTLILGSWKFTSYNSCGDSSGTNTFYNVISFYKDHVYQIKTTTKFSDSLKYVRNDTVDIIGGLWYLSENNKQLKYEDRHYIPLRNWSGLDDSKMYIHTLNDSCLVISYDPTANIGFTHFKRISLLSPVKDNYRPAYFIVNTLDSTKKKKIIQNNFTLHTKTFQNIGNVTKDLSGVIDQISDSSLSIVVANEEIVVDQNKFFSKTNNYYSGSSDQDSLEVQSIKLKDLNLLTYNSSSRESFNSMGSMIMAFSDIALLFVAPLASINFKNGDFNSQKYFSIAGASLTGIAVSIPILIFSKEKKYKMILKNKVKDKKYWYFDASIK